MRKATKKALQKVLAELYKAIVELLIGVLLIIISKHI